MTFRSDIADLLRPGAIVPVDAETTRKLVNALRGEMVPKPHDGGPAFPQPTDMNMGFEGLTRRDYFAAAAMQGLLASGWCADAREMAPGLGERDVAADAYRMADAMLKARDAAS